MNCWPCRRMRRPCPRMVSPRQRITLPPSACPARDSALELLQEALAYDDGTKAAESSAQLEDLVQTALSEATIESLIVAKGYTDCVAYMNADGVSVAVASPEGGLQQDDVAVIADIVMNQSDYSLDEIRVVEVQ